MQEVFKLGSKTKLILKVNNQYEDLYDESEIFTYGAQMIEGATLEVGEKKHNLFEHLPSSLTFYLTDELNSQFIGERGEVLISKRSDFILLTLLHEIGHYFEAASHESIGPIRLNDEINSEILARDYCINKLEEFNASYDVFKTAYRYSKECVDSYVDSYDCKIIFKGDETIDAFEFESLYAWESFETKVPEDEIKKSVRKSFSGFLEKHRIAQAIKQYAK